MPSRFPISSYFSVSSPYENVTPEGPNNGGGGSVFRVSSSSTTADSFITLPRRRHKISSTSSCHSQYAHTHTHSVYKFEWKTRLNFADFVRRSDESGSLYEVPPPPRSLPWLVKQKKRSNSSATVQDVQRQQQQQQPLSVSQSDLLDQDGGERDHRRETKQKHNLSRSFDARSLGFLSLSMSATSPVDDLDDDHVQQRHSSKSSSSVFSRSTRSRHSADQYLPMTGAPSNLMKVSVSFSFFFFKWPIFKLMQSFLSVKKKLCVAESTAKTAEKAAGCFGSLWVSAAICRSTGQIAKYDRLHQLWVADHSAAAAKQEQQPAATDGLRDGLLGSYWLPSRRLDWSVRQPAFPYSDHWTICWHGATTFLIRERGGTR